MTSTFSNPSDYMKDLEFRYHDTSSGMAVTTPIYPTSYRSRGRIGRGGRLVIDRIPVSCELYCIRYRRSFMGMSRLINDSYLTLCAM